MRIREANRHNMKQTYSTPQIAPAVHTREERYKQFLLGFGFWGSIAIVIFLALKYLLRYLMPFVVALAVVALLQSPSRWIARHTKIKKSVVGIILAILVYAVLAGLMVLCSFAVVSTVADWAGSLPAYYTESIAPALSGLGEEGSKLYARLDPELVAFLESIIPSVTSSLSSAVTKFSVKLVSWASSIATSLPKLLLSAVICVIATVFLAADYDSLSVRMRQALPERAGQIVQMVQSAFKTIIKSYISSYLLVMLITFAEISAGLLILRVENAPLIAAVIAVFDILPIVGSGMILAPWAIILLIQGKMGRGIGIAVLYVVVVVARQIMEPKLVGKRVGLHPLATLICLWVGAKTLGVAGMFGFPITLLILKDLRAGGVIGRRRPPEANGRTGGTDETKGSGSEDEAKRSGDNGPDAPAAENSAG